MEPLLSNIEANREIVPIRSEELNAEIPKALAYADDVSVISKNQVSSLQAVFDEYSRLTRLSGLELNADKTEIMRLKHENITVNPPQRFDINYLGKQYPLETCGETKNFP